MARSLLENPNFSWFTWNPMAWTNPVVEEEEEILDPALAPFFGIGAQGIGDGGPYIPPDPPGVINPLTGNNYTLMDYYRGIYPGGAADIAATQQGIAQIAMQRKIREEEEEKAKIANALAIANQEITNEELASTGVDIGITPLDATTQLQAEVQAAAAKRNIQQHTGNGGSQTRDSGQAAARAGGGSQQAKSGGASPSGGRSAHGGWGWAKGGRVRYTNGGIVGLL